MNKRAYKKEVEQFSALLNRMVDYSYFMGGASDDERYLATADFLFTLAHRMLRKVKGDPQLPTNRS